MKNKKLLVIIILILILFLVILLNITTITTTLFPSLNKKDIVVKDIYFYAYSNQNNILKILVRCEDTENGIDIVTYQKDGKTIEIKANGKQKISFDYDIVENGNYQVTFKNTLGEEIVKTLVIDDTYRNNILKFQIEETDGNYKIEIVQAHNLPGTSLSYQLGSNLGDWKDVANFVIETNLEELKYIRDEEGKVTIYIKAEDSVNNTIEQVLQMQLPKDVTPPKIIFDIEDGTKIQKNIQITIKATIEDRESAIADVEDINNKVTLSNTNGAEASIRQIQQLGNIIEIKVFSGMQSGNFTIQISGVHDIAGNIAEIATSNSIQILGNYNMPGFNFKEIVESTELMSGNIYLPAHQPSYGGIDFTYDYNEATGCCMAEYSFDFKYNFKKEVSISKIHLLTGSNPSSHVSIQISGKQNNSWSVIGAINYYEVSSGIVTIPVKSGMYDGIQVWKTSPSSWAGLNEITYQE